MTRNKLALIAALIIGAGVIAGKIATAQAPEPQTPEVVAAIDDQEPTTPAPEAREFSMMFDGGTFLGIYAEDVSRENMARYGMREVRGVGVTQVMKDSPAEKAGIRKDDVIVRFDGDSVTSTRKLNRLVGECSPDQTVRLTISRGGAEQEVSATLSKRNLNGILRGQIRDDVWRGIERSFPPMVQIAPMAPDENFKFNSGDGNFMFFFGNRRIGVSTQTLTKQLADYFGAKDGGILITSVGENTPAAKAGLKAGDVITTVDGEKVNSPGDISRAINKKDDGTVTLTVLRDHNSRTVTLTPEKNPEGSTIRTGTMGSRRVVIPSIQIPAVPEMNIRIPQIVIPATPQIDVTVPRRVPRAARTRVIII
jgi:serine protease Do